VWSWIGCQVPLIPGPCALQNNESDNEAANVAAQNAAAVAAAMAAAAKEAAAARKAAKRECDLEPGCPCLLIVGRCCSCCMQVQPLEV
jgi:hypothetical protein